MTRARAVVAPALGILLLGSCGDGAPGAEGGPAGGVEGEVVVLAAASLTDVLTTLAEGFERRHPAVDVVVDFGPSSGLAQRVVAGAPADVLASADAAPVRTVLDAGVTPHAPRLFARNTLQIAVPPGNPGRVRSLADLTDPDRTVALCARQVPCGAAAAEVFARAGLEPAPDTYEQDVRAVLTKVRLGEVDAGLVYRTDVRAAGDEVDAVDVAEAGSVVNDYLLVRLDGPGTDQAVRAFTSHVLSEEGRQVLDAAGFLPP